MLDPKNAIQNATHAMARFCPKSEFVFASIKPPIKNYQTWVFRCKKRGENLSYICKLSTLDDAGRIAISNQFQKLKALGNEMYGAKFTVPQAFECYSQECAMIMEDVKGNTFQQLLIDISDITVTEEYLRLTGEWLRHFQGITLEKALFDPAPHLNWLAARVQEIENGAFRIPDKAAFFTRYERLKSLGQQVINLPSQRCVTHRDFHSGNIVFRGNGKVYGIDFENEQHDDALRDVMSFLADFLIRWQGASLNFRDYQKAIQPFLAGYSDNHTHPLVIEFFQKFSALNTWAKRGAKNQNAKSNAQKIEVLKQLSDRSLLIDS